MAAQEAALKSQSSVVDEAVDGVEAGMKADEEKKTERPQSAITTEKRTRLQPKFDKVKAKVDVAKEKAQVQFKKGSYAEAIKLYKNAAEILEIA